MNEDVRFIKQSTGWPMYPLLPMKRRRPPDTPEFGLMVAHDLRTVFLLSVDELLSQPYRDFEEMNQKHPCLRYETTEALVEDGWIVD